MAEQNIDGRGIRADLHCLAHWLELMWHGAGTAFAGVSTDSRQIAPGNLFVALRGPNHDGHAYLEAAAQGGAAAALVERRTDADLPQLVVPSTHRALGRIASAWRSELGLPLVGVTGSNGKTTVKEMVAAILGRLGSVLATRGNLNNDIGVPLTLLSLEPGHRYGVIEMGANHSGEIAYLTALTRPQVALVNNAGPAHLAGFGSLEGVARAKGEIYDGLSDDGVAVINADDRFAPLWQQLAGGRATVSFGLERSADVTADVVPETRGSRIRMRTPAGQVEWVLPTPGRHNVLNALAATAVAHALGIGPETVAAALSEFGGVQGRLQIGTGRGGAQLIDDTYNANPASLEAALAVLAERPGRRILVLGDMGELGPGAAELHHQAGAAARAAGIEGLLALGELSRSAVEAFGDGGRHFATAEALATYLIPQLEPETTVLVKGSRAMRMERVVAALRQGEH